MFKKIISFMLCFVMSFALIATTLSASEYSIAEAAKVYETPYYYNQLTDNAKKAYKALKEAVIECKKTLKINYEIDQEDFNKISELLILHDPMTFNLKDIEATSSGKAITFKMTYRYNKETYDKMVKAYKKEADKILSKLTEDMSTYKKIRTIHNSIIKNAEYDLESATSDNIYGTLVKNKGKCDGYSKTFAYICGQAGIRAITVIGDDIANDTDDSLHMWNKVYYNKKWYNVDVSWDDPVSNVKNNLQYDYFMVSDNALAETHQEENLSFEVPAATDDSKNYYVVNKKYAEDFDSAKSLVKNQLISASKKGKTCIDIKCSSKSLYEKLKAYVLDVDKMCKVLKNVKKESDSNIITTIYSYGFNDNLYIVSVYVFYEDTDLDYYFTEGADINSDIRKSLAEYGIK